MSDNIIKNIFGSENKKASNIKANLDKAFEKQDINKLSPAAKHLSSGFGGDYSAVEEPRLGRVKESAVDRNINKASKNIVSDSLEDAKNQVRAALPAVLAQLGLKDKVDANLLIDMIVPEKIKSPIHEAAVMNSVLRDVVLECSANLDLGRLMTREAAVQTHSKGMIKKAGVKSKLDEVFTNMSVDGGINRIDMSSYSRQIKANDGFVPDDSVMPQEQAPVGKVLPISDEEVQRLQGPAGGGLEGPSPTEGIPGDDSHMQEGINPLGNPHELTENDVNLDAMPMDGKVARIRDMISGNFSRKIVGQKIKVEKPKNMHLFTFAGKLSTSVPVEFVKLSNKDRDVINSYAALNNIKAVYSDRSTKAWKFYGTDKGFMLLSDDGALHAKDLKSFANFIETDPSFVRWAFLPPEMDEMDSTHLEEVMDKLEEVKDLLRPDGIGDEVSGMSPAPAPMGGPVPSAAPVADAPPVPGGPGAHIAPPPAAPLGEGIPSSPMGEDIPPVAPVGDVPPPQELSGGPEEEPLELNKSKLPPQVEQAESPEQKPPQAFESASVEEEEIPSELGESEEKPESKEKEESGEENEEPRDEKEEEEEEKDEDERFNALSATAARLLPIIVATFPEESSEDQSDMAIEAALNLLTKQAGDFAAPALNSVDTAVKNVMPHRVNPQSGKAEPVIPGTNLPAPSLAATPAKGGQGGQLVKKLQVEFHGADGGAAPAPSAPAGAQPAAPPAAPKARELHPGAPKGFGATAAVAMDAPMPDEQREALRNKLRSTDKGELFRKLFPNRSPKPEGQAPSQWSKKLTDESTPLNMESEPTDASTHLGGLPEAKRNMVHQITEQLNSLQHDPKSGNFTYPEGSGFGHEDARHDRFDAVNPKELLNRLNELTPHLQHDQRKNLVKKELHPHYDALTNQVSPNPDMEDMSETVNKPIPEESELSTQATKLAEAFELTADCSEDDFAIMCEALLEMDYDMDVITTVASTRYGLEVKAGKEHRFTDKEHRQEKHIEESEKKSGKSTEDAERIGWATVNKQKKASALDSEEEEPYEPEFGEGPEPTCGHRDMEPHHKFCPGCGIHNNPESIRKDTANFWGKRMMNDHWGDHDNVHDYGLD